MTVVEYLGTVKERLLTDTMVRSFQIIRERVTLTDGYIRVRLTLTDDSSVEFSEYVQATPEATINVVTYSYHWADAHGNLIRRWDNTPHFPDLVGFPHHVHDGAAGTAIPDEPVSIIAVLDAITQQER